MFQSLHEAAPFDQAVDNRSDLAGHVGDLAGRDAVEETREGVEVFSSQVARLLVGVIVSQLGVEQQVAESLAGLVQSFHDAARVQDAVSLNRVVQMVVGLQRVQSLAVQDDAVR